jgi:hypothetical protein
LPVQYGEGDVVAESGDRGCREGDWFMVHKAFHEGAYEDATICGVVLSGGGKFKPPDKTPFREHGIPEVV